MSQFRQIINYNYTVGEALALYRLSDSMIDDPGDWIDWNGVEWV